MLSSDSELQPLQHGKSDELADIQKFLYRSLQVTVLAQQQQLQISVLLDALKLKIPSFSNNRDPDKYCNLGVLHSPLAAELLTPSSSP